MEFQNFFSLLGEFVYKESNHGIIFFKNYGGIAIITVSIWKRVIKYQNKSSKMDENIQNFSVL